MTDPFDSSRRKLARARNNLANLKRCVLTYWNQQCLQVIRSEPDPKNPENTVYKLRVLEKAIPDSFSEISGNIVGDLRAVLDHAIYGVAIASGRKNPLNAYFPFSRSAINFEANLKGRCADVPKEIYPLLRSFKPYK